MRVALVNGEVDVVHWVGRIDVRDGVLQLFGEFGPIDREHLGSYPLTSVLKWKAEIPRP